jgi:hypothetical protein
MNEIIDQSYDLIKPDILNVRAKSYEIKGYVYSNLNIYKKALFSFHVFYQHAKNSFDQFEYYSKEYIKIGFWKEIVDGIKLYNNVDFVDNLVQIQNSISKNPNSINLELLYNKYCKLCVQHLVIINKDIKDHSEKYRN